MSAISRTSSPKSAQDRRSAKDFGLTDRALRFAQLRAEHPWWTVSQCAKKAGYSDKGRAAHVRGCELLRDARAIEAIIHFSSLELVKAQAEATRSLRSFANYGDLDGWTVRSLTADVRLLASRTNHLSKILASLCGCHNPDHPGETGRDQTCRAR